MDTFVHHSLKLAKEIDSNTQVARLFRSMSIESMETRLIEGLQAFAVLYFLEFTDATELPPQFYWLVNLIEENYIADVSELQDDDDYDEDDPDTRRRLQGCSQNEQGEWCHL